MALESDNRPLSALLFLILCFIIVKSRSRGREG